MARYKAKKAKVSYTIINKSKQPIPVTDDMVKALLQGNLLNIQKVKYEEKIEEKK